MGIKEYHFFFENYRTLASAGGEALLGKLQSGWREEAETWTKLGKHTCDKSLSLIRR